MEDFRKKILDWHEDEPTKKWFHHWTFVFLPIILFVLGAIFRLQRWPFASMLMGTALALLFLRSLVFFFSKKRDVFDWIYFIGRMTLILALAINFAFVPLGRKILISALALFGLSILFFIFRKKSSADESGENADDDY